MIVLDITASPADWERQLEALARYLRREQSVAAKLRQVRDDGAARWRDRLKSAFGAAG